MILKHIRLPLHRASESCLAVDFFSVRDRGEFVKQLSAFLMSQNCEAYSRGSEWIECLLTNCISEVDNCGLSVKEINKTLGFWSERLNKQFTWLIP